MMHLKIEDFNVSDICIANQNIVAGRILCSAFLRANIATPVLTINLTGQWQP